MTGAPEVVSADLERLVARVEEVMVLGSRLSPSVAAEPVDCASPSGSRRRRRWRSAGTRDARRALDLAAQAQPGWGRTTLSDRIGLITHYTRLLSDQAAAIAELIVLETGKTMTHARAEVGVALAVAQELVSAARGSGVLEPGTISTPEVDLQIRPVPVGPALLITPWNFPLAMASRKVVSALLCGCTAILKPSERTPLTAMVLGSLLVDSGIPDGVLSVLPTMHSPQVVAVLTADPALRKISFTGSTAVGREILRASTENFQRTSLELGGNAPCVILPDADIAATVQTIWAAKLFNNGQACTAPTRVLVPRSLSRQVEDGFADLAKSTSVGDPWSETVELGPLIGPEAVTRLAGLLAAGSCGRVVAGRRAGLPAAEFPATVALDAPADAALCRTELFGPVLPIIRYPDDDLDACVTLANATEYGLASYVYGSDPERVRSVVDRLEFGMTGVNTGTVSHPKAPFGGRKYSGFGRENGATGLKEYLDLHTVHFSPSPAQE